MCARARIIAAAAAAVQQEKDQRYNTTSHLATAAAHCLYMGTRTSIICARVSLPLVF